MKDKFCTQCGSKRWGREPACIHCGAKFLDDAKCIVHPLDQVNPWWRFWARMFDFELYHVIFSTVFLEIFHGFLNKLNIDLFLREIVFFVLFTVFAIFTESYLIASTGSTLGKFLFKIKVKDSDYRNLSFEKSLERTCLVYKNGMAFGIKVISFIFYWKAKRRLETHGITSWDETICALVLHKEVDWRACVCVFFTIVFKCLYSWILNIASVTPPA